MERSLVTGASGFIGSALCRELTKRGQEVVQLERRLLHEPEELRAFIEGLHPDYIWHNAAYGNKYAQQHEMDIVLANIMGTMNLLQASKDVNYAAFINTGTSSEYGTKKHPMKEGDSLDTDTFYGASKASSTLLCRAFAKKYGKPVVTVRPFSVYGPNEDPSKFIPTVVKCAKTHETLKLAPGVHDWIYIDDYIEAILLVARCAKGLAGQSVNIGTGIQHSNHAVVATVREITGNPVKTEHTGSLRDYDTNISWVADISKLKALGWKPAFDLERGLTRVIYGTSD